MSNDDDEQLKLMRKQHADLERRWGVDAYNHTITKRGAFTNQALINLRDKRRKEMIDNEDEPELSGNSGKLAVIDEIEDGEDKQTFFDMVSKPIKLSNPEPHSPMYNGYEDVKRRVLNELDDNPKPTFAMKVRKGAIMDRILNELGIHDEHPIKGKHVDEIQVEEITTFSIYGHEWKFKRLNGHSWEVLESPFGKLVPMDVIDFLGKLDEN